MFEASAREQAWREKQQTKTKEDPAMDHTIVHFEIPADDPERAAKFYRELFGWEIQKWSLEGGPDYWMVATVPTDGKGQTLRPGVNGGLIGRRHPGHLPTNYIGVENLDEYARKATASRRRGSRAEDPGEGNGLVRVAEGPGGERLRNLADGREGRVTTWRRGGVRTRPVSGSTKRAWDPSAARRGWISDT